MESTSYTLELAFWCSLSHYLGVNPLHYSLELGQTRLPFPPDSVRCFSPFKWGEARGEAKWLFSFTIASHQCSKPTAWTGAERPS